MLIRAQFGETVTNKATVLEAVDNRLIKAFRGTIIDADSFIGSRLSKAKLRTAHAETADPSRELIRR